MGGAIDLHAHHGPDAYDRQWDAFEVVKLAKERGMRAVVLKNHWTETAGLATLIRKYGTQGIEVLALDAPTSMVWGSPGTSWVWQLDPVGSEATRLVTRIRSRPTGAPSSLAFGVLLELADVWMLRKMLRTVQLRAQRLG